MPDPQILPPSFEFEFEEQDLSEKQLRALIVEEVRSFRAEIEAVKRRRSAEKLIRAKARTLPWCCNVWLWLCVSIDVCCCVHSLEMNRLLPAAHPLLREAVAALLQQRHPVLWQLPLLRAGRACQALASRYSAVRLRPVLAVQA